MDLKWEQKVYEIVMRAQEKMDAELDAFLDIACEGDEPTRKEVERRLEGIQKVIENTKKLFD